MASEKVQVNIRIRPSGAHHRGTSCVQVIARKECTVPLKYGDKRFTYDTVFDHNCTQSDVFHHIGRNTVTGLLKGYNHTILAYGQTGSGKTHTIYGPDGGNPAALQAGTSSYENRGLVPRVLEELFSTLKKLPSAETSWKVLMSGFELYQENICDILSPQPLPPSEYKIREDSINGRGVYIEKLCVVEVCSVLEAMQVVLKCMQSRKTAATQANDTSSRSHSVIVVTVEQVSHVQDGTRVQAQLNLVDLAGSEKVDKTGAEGERLKEAQKINLSLTLLGNVIYKLTDGKSVHIPYRDSKLTRILQDSLGGNARTTLLCCCSGAESNKAETLSTMQFASRAKQIQNRPIVNKELTLSELTIAYAKAQEEIRILKDRLAAGGNANKSDAGVDQKAIAGLSTPRTDPSGLTSTDEVSELRNTVDSLVRELSEVKLELFEKIKEIDELKTQVDFYKKRYDSLQNDLTRKAAECEQHKQTIQVWKAKYQQVAASAASKGVSPNSTAPPTSTPPASTSTHTRRMSNKLNSSTNRHPHKNPTAPSTRDSRRSFLSHKLSQRQSSESQNLLPTETTTPIISPRSSTGSHFSLSSVSSTSTANSVTSSSNLITDPGTPTGRSGMPVIPNSPLSATTTTSSPSASTAISPLSLTGRSPAFLENELAKSKDNEAQLMIKNSEAHSTIIDLEEDLAKHQHLLKVEKKNSQDWVQKLSRLQVQFEEKNEQLDTLQREREMHRKDLTNKDAQIKQLQEKLDILSSSLVAAETTTSASKAKQTVHAEPVKRTTHQHTTVVTASANHNAAPEKPGGMDQLAIDIMVKGEELLEAENDIYMLESQALPFEERDVTKGNVTNVLLELEQHAKKALQELRDGVITGSERHKTTLMNQLTEHNKQIHALQTRLENPHRSGTRRLF
eukprot:TRINITY_DN59391_c1_g1_i1.p1 TRINITY_DN59391_c1_g1~~TRINITY_DN59391_c1_g1_i1.p1  ORF type:complete len:905 (+),score=82.31 TRINITY_DN59391_c1_g1_i1:94-2808(+)